jgi:hypothetical protein
MALSAPSRTWARPRALALAFALGGAGSSGARADESPAQRVRLELRAEGAPAGLRLEAETVWLGEARRVELQDDGRGADGRPGDGLYSAEWTGLPVRQLALRLYARAPGEERVELAASTETLALGDDRLVWVLEADEGGRPPRARRTAAPLPGRSSAISDEAGVVASLGWMLLAFAYVAFLVTRPAEKGRPRSAR